MARPLRAILALALGLSLAVGCSPDAQEDAAPGGGDPSNNGATSANNGATSANNGATATNNGATSANNGTTTDPGPDPGRITLHRLNRVEYNNTARDLLGTDLRPADDFPADDIGHGFDNNADVLSMSPLLLDLYESAAEALIEDALKLPRAEPDIFNFEAEDMTSDVGAVYRGEGWNLWSNGALVAIIQAPEDGQYDIEVRAFGHQGGPDLPHMTVSADGALVQAFDVDAVEDGPGIYRATTRLAAGSRAIAVEFTNDYYDPDNNADRNLIVDWIRITGPTDNLSGDTSKRDAILTCDPVAGGQTCAREVIAGFLPRAWRRPVTDAEIDRLMTLVQLAEDQGDPTETGIKLALTAALTSPHFVFRVELDPDPEDTTPHLLSDHELASRLSYFLWSSMPDAALLEAADAGRLKDPEELRRQTQRMLADPRSRALVENFAGQWLYTRALQDIQPDYNAYPDFDDALRSAMQIETELFFEEFLREDLDIHDMITARFTYLNDRLAAHYGVPGPGGEGFERVELTGERRGLLGHGSVLTVTSYPTRTSPVKRGKWILTQLLCNEPAPPPPGVEGLIEPDEPAGTLREQLEAHRANPDCAACHDAMDPLGFGLEAFDGIGALRAEDAHGFPIDASGTLPTGESFNGPSEMADVLTEDPNFARCVTWQLYTYALGRGISSVDTPHLRTIRDDFAAANHRLPALIEAIVLSDAFRKRRGETPAQGGE